MFCVIDLQHSLLPQLHYLYKTYYNLYFAACLGLDMIKNVFLGSIYSKVAIVCNISPSAALLFDNDLWQ